MRTNMPLLGPEVGGCDGLGVSGTMLMSTEYWSTRFQNEASSVKADPCFSSGISAEEGVPRRVLVAALAVAERVNNAAVHSEVSLIFAKCLTFFWKREGFVFKIKIL